MKATINYNGREISIDLSQPIDLTLTIANEQQINCFGAPYFYAEPLRFGDFALSTASGASCNCFDIKINPHCNGTHTECVGHIADIQYNVFELIQPIAGFADVISMYPEKNENGDRVITLEQCKRILPEKIEKILLIRTLPNDENKRSMNYSGTNPPYIHHEAMLYLVQQGVEHLLIDTPSVDREDDGGKMLAHKAFWNYPSENVRMKSSITELVFIPNEVKDGKYFIQVNFPNFGLDAAPSKVLLYTLK